MLFEHRGEHFQFFDKILFVYKMKLHHVLFSEENLSQVEIDCTYKFLERFSKKGREIFIIYVLLEN